MSIGHLVLAVACIGCAASPPPPPAPPPAERPATPATISPTEPDCDEIIRAADAFSRKTERGPLSEEERRMFLGCKDEKVRSLVIAMYRCEILIERSEADLARVAGTPGAALYQAFLRACFLDKSLGGLLACVDAAGTAEDVTRCWSGITRDKLGVMLARRPPESSVVLREIATATEAEVARTGRFPVADVPATPTMPCCDMPGRKCATSGGEWDGPAWKKLGVPKSNRGLFQYMYSSEGTTAFIAAIGDMDCDGTTIMWRLDGRIADGKAVWTMTPPPPNTD